MSILSSIRWTAAIILLVIIFLLSVGAVKVATVFWVAVYFSCFVVGFLAGFLAGFIAFIVGCGMIYDIARPLVGPALAKDPSKQKTRRRRNLLGSALVKNPALALNSASNPADAQN